MSSWPGYSKPATVCCAPRAVNMVFPTRVGMNRISIRHLSSVVCVFRG
jgi:hypothetical protein